MPYKCSTAILTSERQCNKRLSSECSKSRYFKSNFSCLECFKHKARSYAKEYARIIASKNRLLKAEIVQATTPGQLRRTQILADSNIISWDW